MSEKISVRVQHKRMTASQWNASNIILLEGELGIESDTGNVKVGDGRSRYSALKYLTGPKGDRGLQGERGPQGIQGVQGPKGERGYTGAQGPQGIQGPKGQDGTMRFEDLTSAQKATLKGDKGDRGPQGERGYTGATGAQGIQGVKGDRGASIYSSSYSGLSANSSGYYITDLRPSVSIYDLVIGSLVVSPKGDIFAVTSKNTSSSPQSFGVGPLLANIKGDTGLKGNDGARGPQGERGARGVNIIKHNGDLYGAGQPGQTNTFSRSNLQPSDIAMVGDIVFDQYPHENGVDIDFWRITALDANNCTVAGLSKGFTIPKGNQGERGPQGPQGVQGPKGDRGERGYTGAKGDTGARGADGRPGQNIINQNGGQQLKYWAGTEQEYNNITYKDSNTIYDIYK